MRIALLSDIHGNPIALDAVLRDIAEQGGINRILVLGDLVALGHDPVGVLERLKQLPNVYCTRGNTDRYVTTDNFPGAFVDATQASGEERRVVRALRKFIPDGVMPSHNTCPKCQTDSLVYQEGCLHCKNCGHSECS